MGKSAVRKSVVDSPVIIERREVVTTIHPDTRGEHPMLRAAFMAASDYIAEHEHDNTVSLEWIYEGTVFRASSERLSVPVEAETSEEF